MAFTRKEPSRYRSQTPDSAIEAAEFSFVGGQHYCFFTLRNSADSKGFIAKLHAPPLAQEVISSTKTGTGELLVTRGALAPQATLQALSGMGEHLTPILPPSKKFDPWVWRGITSLVGQSLTLTSGLLAAEKGADRNALFGFAGLNLLANICNITFGAQEKPDPAQLRLLKQKVNQDVLAAGGNETSLPGIDDDRLALRPPEPRTFGQRSYDFLQKYSVSGGEIGLRTIGAASLAFPLKSKDKRKDGGFPFGPNDNPVTYKAGWATLAGKGISSISTEPDPYNPEPPSLIRRLRERVTFPLSSIVEMVAAGFMAHDRFTKQKIKWGGKEIRDYPAAIGNAVFVGGYLIRLAAPYGSREVKIPELAAHIADSLATLPPEKITAQLAETCHMLARHFAGKQGGSLSQIYTLVTDELDRQHHIRLPAVAGGEKSAPHASPPPPSVTATKVQQIAHEGRAEHQAAAALYPH